MSEIDVYITSLPRLEAAVRRLAARIDAPERSLPTFTTYVGDGTPHIDLQSDGFNFVISERGEEYERVVSWDAKEILWLVFSGITFEMATKYELARRVDSQDFRRLVFSRQVELLALLSSEWAEREAREHDRILEAYPFDDSSSARVALTKALRDAGATEEAAWEEACARYPLPEEAE